jgi:hypothetical protein
MIEAIAPITIITEKMAPQHEVGFSRYEAMKLLIKPGLGSLKAVFRMSPYIR